VDKISIRMTTSPIEVTYQAPRAPSMGRPASSYHEDSPIDEVCSFSRSRRLLELGPPPNCSVTCKDCNFHLSIRGIQPRITNHQSSPFSALQRLRPASSRPKRLDPAPAHAPERGAIYLRPVVSLATCFSSEKKTAKHNRAQSLVSKILGKLCWHSRLQDHQVAPLVLQLPATHPKLCCR
jgi:hypothetical protein